MRIGIEFTDAMWKGKDFSRPDRGNPGMGGTQYDTLILAYAYAKQYTEDQVYLLHTEETNRLPDVTNNIVIKKPDREEIIKRLQLDIIVINTVIDDDDFLRSLKENNIRIIIIAHNFMNKEWMRKLCIEKAIRRVVFVGNEQYDWCIDAEIVKKSTVIGNMVVCNHDRYRGDIEQCKPIVTYMGALLPQKGFHLLAEQWQYVLSKVPDAQLYVIGSGKLYDPKAKLGKYGLTQEEYENMFMKYLTDENGNILESVHFMGTMGQEKEDILIKTAVGVPNPSADSETFCRCAVEMESYGIPLVTKAKNSFFDVTIDGKTALLYHSKRDFGEKLVRLLSDQKLNEKMGQMAREYVQKYSPEELAKEWNKTFVDLMEDTPPKYIRNYKHLFYNLKFLRIINRGLRVHLRLRFLPCAIEGYRSGIKMKKDF